MCRLDPGTCDASDAEGSHSTKPSLPQLQAYSWIETPAFGYEFLRLVIVSAWRGQRLTQLTIIFTIHCVLHLHVLAHKQATSWSLTLLHATGLLLLCGYTLLVALYRHSVPTVFNCMVPSRFLPSFAVHLALMKPLEIIFRYLTLQFRVLPDIIVLGEVRCGTTSMCQHLASVNGCHEPFCLWRHPELDKKETFFFVGHYLGIVDPQSYSMCFPLAITRFVNRRILRRPFFTFDGCAQYLSSPTAPYLIAKAYKDAGQPPPVLVACVRDPVDQALSWWNYENNAISWGKSMGLVDWNTNIRTKDYPPGSLSSAIAFSSSEKVKTMHKRAEELFQDNTGVASFFLPDWAMTWPGGQLSGIGRNGCFAANVRRYERVFCEVFGESDHVPAVPSASTLKFVNVVPLEYMKSDELLRPTLDSIMAQINRRSVSAQPRELNGIRPRVGVHRNASANLSNPTSKEKAELTELFWNDTRELESMCGTEFGWKTSRCHG
jgi:hypothetical protein